MNFNSGTDENGSILDDDYDDVGSVGWLEDSADAMPFEGNVDPAPGVPVPPPQTKFLAPEPAGEYESEYEGDDEADEVGGEDGLKRSAVHLAPVPAPQQMPFGEVREESDIGEAAMPYASLPSSFAARPKSPLESIISPVSFGSAAARPSQTATGFTSILEKFRQAANESTPLMALTPLTQHMRAAPWKKNSDGGWENRAPEEIIETTWNRQPQLHIAGKLAHNPAQFTTPGESSPAVFSEELMAHQGRNDTEEKIALRAQLLEGNRQATPVMGDILAD